MIRFFNSLTRRTEGFEPLAPPRVGLYTCGPTVHDYAHIGNFRAYVWEDLLRRHLEYRGYDVTHVMNITDVEDKIIRKAGEAGVTIEQWTQRFTKAFFEDAETLGLLPAHEYPRATGHIAEMIDLCRRLAERGHTYESNGSVYFRIGSFAEYGKLCGLQRDALRVGTRVDADEYQKDDPCDFVLWKGSKPGEPTWDSPWGPGRPGWHLECSAMAMKYLGDTFDIHTGGVDNKFPHHENEIAQSEGASGRPFVRYWMHCAHLVVEGEKMSKSLGNFYTLRDLLEQGHEPRTIRHVLIGTHYRKPLDFGGQSVEQARSELARIDELRRRLASESAAGDSATLAGAVARAREAFGGHLDDDLNISGALGELFKLVREVNGALDRGEASTGDAAAFETLIEDLDRVVGTLRGANEGDAAAGEEVRELVEQRQRAREARDWGESDRLRDLIAERGWIVEDTAKGPRLKARR